MRSETPHATVARQLGRGIRAGAKVGMAMANARDCGRRGSSSAYIDDDKQDDTMLRTKRLFTLLSLMGSCCFSSSGWASTVWQGQYLVVSVTPPCVNQGSNSKGQMGTMIYRPVINGGDAPEGLAVVGTSASSMSLYTSAAAGGLLRGNVRYKGQRISSTANFDSFNSTSDLQITPNVIASDAALVTITGTINNWFNHPGCSVKFKVHMQPTD
jgi:hypothetical protein